jgi:PPOX class probable F420-dependent enzyme
MPMPERVVELLRLANPAVMATVAADGRPVTVATWYLLEDDGHILLGLDAKRARLKHMHADPRISLTVLADDDWYTHVSLQGRVVSITDDVGLRDIDRPLGPALHRSRVLESPASAGECSGRDRALARVGQAACRETSHSRRTDGPPRTNRIREP